LYEMVVVGQGFQNSLATHRRHGYAVHKTVALVSALLIQTQTRQKGLTRLWMNRHAPVIQDPTNSSSSRIPQVAATVRQTVQEFG
jgi:hypothetical protein